MMIPSAKFLFIMDSPDTLNPKAEASPLLMQEPVERQQRVSWPQQEEYSALSGPAPGHGFAGNLNQAIGADINGSARAGGAGLENRLE
jgi:hypothetical protein